MIQLLIKCKSLMAYMALSRKKDQDEVIALIKEIDKVIAKSKT